MPYIKATDYVRASLEPVVPGELNYAMTMQAIFYLMGQIDMGEFRGKVEELCAGFMECNGVSYTNYNNMIGALTCCGWELVRRANDERAVAADNCQKVLVEVGYRIYYELVVPYEDTKIAENGDVYPKNLVRGS